MSGRGILSQQTLAYDLWGNDGDTKATPNPTKKGGRPVGVKRGRANYTPSALPAVVVPSEGASYNPPLHSYLAYTEQISKEEKRSECAKQKLEKALLVDEEEANRPSILTEDFDVLLDAVAGNYETKEEVGEIDIDDVQDSATRNKPKTEKQRRAELRRKLEEQQRLELKERKKTKNKLDQLKSINREVNSQVEGHEKERAVRRTTRAIQRLTKRKRLGRGKFEEYAEPVLLPSELTGSLRRLKPQGDIFEERINRFQQRNMLPIAGQRAKPTLKTKLRVKIVEKREMRKIGKGSQVI